jgi:hypothetical protein
VNPRRIDGKDGVAGSIPAGGSTQALTSGNAGEPPSGAVAAGHVRIGMGCGRSVRRQSAKSLADQQVWLWSIRYGLNWAGRIAVTEHIAGPRSVSVVAALAAGGGSCRPGCGFWWLLGWIKAVTGDRRSLHGRSPVGSERPGLYTLSGSVRPRRVVRFARLIHRRVRAFGPAFGRRRLRRQFQPDLLATQRDAVEARRLACSGARASGLKCSAGGVAAGQ